MGLNHELEAAGQWFTSDPTRCRYRSFYLFHQFARCPKGAQCDASLNETLSSPPSTPISPPKEPEQPKLPDLTAAEQKDTIAPVRAGWRSESGETIDQILATAAKVAHFYRRGSWDAYRDSDGRPATSVGFVTSKLAEDNEVLSIHWRLESDETFTIEPRGYKSISLGSKPFSLTLIWDEVISEIKGPNLRYLFDPRTLDWVKTEAGPLSELLVRARCVPVANLQAAYFTPADDHSNKTGHDEWTFQTSEKCRAGSVYCADEGPVIFTRADIGLWKPESTCARILVGQEPLDFIRPLLREQVH